MTNQQDNVYDGACTCGSVRYRVTNRPLFVHCCHCHWCQRETGSAFVINAMIESAFVELLEGRVQTIHTPSASGKGQDVARCPDCHIGLWSHYAGLGDLMSFVRVGTLNEPDRLPPDIHIFTESKQAWVVLPQDVPSVPAYYKKNEHWPEESILRQKALFQ